jgi:hypothetical protein
MRSLAVLALAVLSLSAARPARAETVLAHDVFFALKDNSKEARAKLVAACKKYLTGHEGTVYFAAGTVASGLDSGWRLIGGVGFVALGALWAFLMARLLGRRDQAQEE